MQLEIYPIEPAKNDKRVGEILDLCEEEGMSHYPVADRFRFTGMVRCDDLTGMKTGMSLKDAEHFVEHFRAREDDDWTRLFAEFLTNETNVLPVLDEHGQYLGVVFLEDLLEDLSEINAFHIEGTLIRISKATDDFSFFQVAQIIESAGGKLLGMLVIEESDTHIVLDIKIEKGDINEILQNLRRYDYEILSRHEEDQHLQDIREHAEFLNKYLRMGEE